MKTCSKCKIEKPFSGFHKNHRTKDGLQSKCRGCIKAYDKVRYQKNMEKERLLKKAYYEENRDRIKARQKAYYEANKDKVKVRQKAYYEANKGKKKAYIKEYQRERLKTDSLYKLKHRLRVRTSQAFRRKGYRKNTKTQEMLGVDWDIAKAHIERQFKKGMTWENHGEWHIDHIIPLSKAKTEKELIRLCHYTNLQPLWGEENLTKGNKILGQQTKLRV